VVVQTYNPNIQEDEAGRSEFEACPGHILSSRPAEAILQKNNKKMKLPKFINK
jgi:hypothetical protein